MQCAILGLERCDKDAIWGYGEEGTPGGGLGVISPPEANDITLSKMLFYSFYKQFFFYFCKIFQIFQPFRVHQFQLAYYYLIFFVDIIIVFTIILSLWLSLLLILSLLLLLLLLLLVKCPLYSLKYWIISNGNRLCSV